MAATEDQNALARFYNNKQFSDVIVKYGENELYAHKVILAERSAYFARAFLGQFAVASSSTIDLGDEDDPEMIREMIRSMYVRDDALRYSVMHQDERSLASLVDMFILADKYDLPQLRRKLSYTFEAKLDDHYSSHEDEFIRTIIARVCGPAAIQFADKALQRSVSKHCKMHYADLLQHSRFVDQYTEGTLFNSEFALAFNLHIDCIALGSQDEPNLIETMIHKLYDLQYNPDPEDWITFSADMYLVAKKYGLDKIAKVTWRTSDLQSATT
ncbi:unnamed protein product [Aureobasidium mustum]|uniref:BTB domain-containing protein n=1 Tax=Aureobasidium mustum TaxID=2773714 RepID=A0A9N8K7T5_9PEZI|nr:unnamed protein product [Aureobasidium mustum]